MENNNYGTPQRQERYDPIRHINELIEIVQDASGMPFSDKCQIERSEMLASLKALRDNLPPSVAQANDIVQRAQDIIGTAREKNKKILDDANRMYATKVNDHEITRGAREEADRIINEAEARAEELRRNAHLYVKDLLEKTNETLAECSAKIQTNITEIDTSLDTM